MRRYNCEIMQLEVLKSCLSSSFLERESDKGFIGNNVRQPTIESDQINNSCCHMNVDTASVHSK